MIQRPQSVYLFLGALLVGALGFFEVLWTSAASQMLGWFNPAVLGAGTLVIVIAIAAIFLYRDRKRQLKIVVALQGVLILFLLAMIGGLYMGGTLDQVAGNVPLIVALALPVLAYVMFWLARKGIEKDIALVRSMDRLR
ncbi:MAG: DUF4293 domain-containing protein [Bacteroidota bacterium]